MLVSALFYYYLASYCTAVSNQNVCILPPTLYISVTTGSSASVVSTSCTGGASHPG